MPTAQTLCGWGARPMNSSSGWPLRPSSRRFPAGRNKPHGGPRSVSPKAIEGPAAVIDGQAIIGGKVAVDVKEQFDAVCAERSGRCACGGKGEEGTAPSCLA